MSAMSPLSAALVLAIPWTLIHIGMFLPGQWYGALAIWPLVLSIFFYSILLTWIYVRTGGSVLMTAPFPRGAQRRRTHHGRRRRRCLVGHPQHPRRGDRRCPRGPWWVPQPESFAPTRQ
jgi:hypothetical protein